MDQSFNNLIQLGRRWWWLLILAPMVAGGVAFAQVSRQQQLYSASATVEINPPTLGTDFIYYDPTIVATYRELITTTSVLGPLIARLDLPLTEEALRSKISTEPVESTRLLRISVSDTDPETAALLANEVANDFAGFALNRTQELSGPYREALDQQIEQTQANIATQQQVIDNLSTGANASAPEVQAQIETLRQNVRDLQGTYRELVLSASRMDLQEASAQTGVVVVQDAAPPSAPYAPDVQLYSLLAAFAGLCLAIGAIAVYEYLDNTAKVETPYLDLIGAPLLATIPLIPGLSDESHHQLFLIDHPSSSPAESMRLLRTSIEFAAASNEIATLAVISSGPGEGKSTITANLGVSLAQAGFSVAVIDADLRRPSLHRIFGVQNERGLSNLLSRADLKWQDVARAVPGLNLFLISSGPIPPNPADLLRSERLRTLLDHLRSQVDIVVVDTPPALAASDALVVADASDAVIMVARDGHTRIDKLQAAMNTLPESARVIGVLLNQLTRQTSGDYSGYYQESLGEPGPDSTSGATISAKLKEIVSRPDRRPGPTSGSD